MPGSQGTHAPSILGQGREAFRATSGWVRGMVVVTRLPPLEYIEIHVRLRWQGQILLKVIQNQNQIVRCDCETSGGPVRHFLTPPIRVLRPINPFKVFKALPPWEYQVHSLVPVVPAITRVPALHFLLPLPTMVVLGTTTTNHGSHGSTTNFTMVAQNRTWYTPYPPHTRGACVGETSMTRSDHRSSYICA